MGKLSVFVPFYGIYSIVFESVLVTDFQSVTKWTILDKLLNVVKMYDIIYCVIYFTINILGYLWLEITENHLTPNLM